MSEENNNEFATKNAWLEMENAEIEEIMSYSQEYADFLSANKTEREFVESAVELLRKEGFRPLENTDNLEAGDRIYSVNRGRQIFIAVIGENDLREGVRLLGSHIDSPRLDLKPNPLYEDGEMALLDTHYYGGIKKYQWVTIPLALHGLVVREDGSKLEVNIGEEDDDPVFYISDILPHLGKEQMKKKMSKAITGEDLNVIIGSRPVDDDDEGKKIKKQILALLQDKYDITGEDFVSADLQIVPALETRDVGFDRGLLAGYGHDDRVCSYAALQAILDVEMPEYTAVTLLVDKEEIGSMGNTGMQSRYFENTVAHMVSSYYGEYDELAFRELLHNTEALSGDVNAAYDPDFAGVFAKNNSSYLNKGIVLTKYTGARGKAGGSEATAEFVGKVRALFNEAGIIWQIGELGKVDKGGGGTIAKFLANYSMEVIDSGPPVLSMHSPYELVSKVDIYNTYLGYSVFLNSGDDK
ncbi:MAG: aminopeptidase [Halanaerobiales bacterium]